jgi:hypothetical protein
MGLDCAICAEDVFGSGERSEASVLLWLMNFREAEIRAGDRAPATVVIPVISATDGQAI